MIRPEDLYGIGHYDYGEEYFGSDKGMRFRVARQPLENVIGKKPEEWLSTDPRLSASVWFTPFSYEKTPKEEITVKEFSYDSEGYTEMIDWLNTETEKG